jgi:hypothetical protein
MLTTWLVEAQLAARDGDQLKPTARACELGDGLRDD